MLKIRVVVDARRRQQMDAETAFDEQPRRVRPGERPAEDRCGAEIPHVGVRRRISLAEPVCDLRVESNAETRFVARRRPFLEIPAHAAAIDRNECAARISARGEHFLRQQQRRARRYKLAGSARRRADGHERRTGSLSSA